MAPEADLTLVGAGNSGGLFRNGKIVMRLYQPAYADYHGRTQSRTECIHYEDAMQTSSKAHIMKIPISAVGKNRI
jgi:hypothetical protein